MFNRNETSNSFSTDLHSGVALAADRGQELLETVLAVQITLLLYESDVGQRAFAVAVVADEVVRAPDAAEGGDEWTSAMIWVGENVIIAHFSQYAIFNRIFYRTH